MAKVTVNTKDFISNELIKFLQEVGHELPDGSDAQKGFITICSSKSDWSEPEELGKVLHVCTKGVRDMFC